MIPRLASGATQRSHFYEHRRDPLVPGEQRRTSTTLGDFFACLERAGVPSFAAVFLANYAGPELGKDAEGTNLGGGGPMSMLAQSRNKLRDDGTLDLELFGEKKLLFYQITREYFIRQCLTDYSSIPDLDAEQLDRRLTSLCNKYGVLSKELNTARVVFRPGWCFLCNALFSPYSPEECPRAQLQAHLSVAHNNSRDVPSERSRKALERFKEERAADRRTRETDLLSAHSGDFTLLSSLAVARRRYLCHWCMLEFHTTMGAMIAHAEAHRRNDYIKIGIINRGEEVGRLRPEQHAFDPKRGAYWWGSDAVLHAVYPPADAVDDNNPGTVSCRKCRSFQWELVGLSARALGKRVESMREHEACCKAIPAEPVGDNDPVGPT